MSRTYAPPVTLREPGGQRRTLDELVSDGRITRQGEAQARLLRDNVVIWEGKLASLKRFKDDVSEVKAGFECGIGLQNFNDVKVGDVIEVFQLERVAATV